MRRLWAYLSAIVCMMTALYGCGTESVVNDAEAWQQIEEVVDTLDDAAEKQEADEDAVTSDAADDAEVSDEATDQAEALTDEQDNPEVGIADVQTEDPQYELIAEDGFYTTPEDVALYIYTYGDLPDNFITKKEAQALGWVSKKGNLDEVAPGMSIGGDRFGNYEQTLPDGEYRECDVNYEGGYRGDERLVYTEDGDVYYTNDHYATFIQLYDSEE